jgi:polar amino acid transport system substrate-binding protein
MKKFLALALSVIMALAVFTGCGNSGSSNGSADNTSDAKTFTVGFDAEYPPFGYMAEDGSYTGFDLELAQAVCDLEGWTFVAKPIEWDSKNMELDSGSIDCIWNGFTINGREDQYTWSQPYCDNTQVVVVKEGSGINTLADLAGKNVGVQSDSAAESVLTDEEQQKELGDSFASMPNFGDYNTAFAELDAGAIDAIAVDVGVAKYQLSSREGFVMLSENLNSEQYGVGFKLGNEELRDIVDADLEKLAEDGTVAELAAKYEIEDMICIGK